MAYRKVEINWEAIEKLCSMHCTMREISLVIGVDEETIDRHCKKEHKQSFAEFYTNKKDAGKASLRRAQWLSATEERNPTMMIWLGKQLLGQTERTEIIVDTSRDTVNKLLASITDEDLKHGILQLDQKRIVRSEGDNGGEQAPVGEGTDR